MTDIIRDAVRAGCGVQFPDGEPCLYPGCGCPEGPGWGRHGLQTAARHAAEAMREKAALTAKADARRQNAYEIEIDDVCDAIRAIPTEGDTNETDR